MNYFCCFDGLGKMKNKFITSCLDALAELRNTRGASRYAALMGNYPTFSYMLGPTNRLNDLLSVRCRCCTGHEILWPRERSLCLQKKVEMKCMQLNALKNIARMTRSVCVLVISHTHFRVNLHSVVAWISRNSLLKTGAISEV